MKQFRNLIFDVGNVIINVDESAALREFQKLSDLEFTDDMKYAEHQFVREYEGGRITTEQFRKKLRGFLRPSVKDEEIDAAWNAILLAYPPEKFELLKQLKKRYHVLALSNTNELHVKKFNQAAMDLFGEPFANFFHRVYYSHIIRLQKPGTEIYKLVLQKENLNPDDTFFVDDKIENVEAAKSVGIHAFQLKDRDKLKELLTELHII
jgi:glucose-1-phosphatase